VKNLKISRSGLQSLVYGTSLTAAVSIPQPTRHRGSSNFHIRMESVYETYDFRREPHALQFAFRKLVTVTVQPASYLDTDPRPTRTSLSGLGEVVVHIVFITSILLLAGAVLLLPETKKI
jgi:hypothetical protein